MIIGITGKSGAGKSTLSKLIKKFGDNFEYIDFDSIAHQTLDDKEVQDLIKRKLDIEVSSTNRKELANFIFNNQNKTLEVKMVTTLMWDKMKEIIDNKLKDNSKKRNRGYGSKILNDIKEKYQDKTILLCYEEVDEKYEDFLDRKNREKFYSRNGFINNELKTQEGEVVYQSAIIGNRKVTFEEYKILFDLCYGKGANEKYLKEYK